jgi:hypothetical protein
MMFVQERAPRLRQQTLPVVRARRKPAVKEKSSLAAALPTRTENEH